MHLSFKLTHFCNVLGPLTKADAQKLEQEYSNSVTKKKKSKKP